MKIRVADYIANFLSENGVQHVFTVTGGGALIKHFKKLLGFRLASNLLTNGYIGLFFGLL